MITRIAIAFLALGLLAPVSCVSRLDEKSPETSGVGDKAVSGVGSPSAPEEAPSSSRNSCADQACVSSTDCCTGFVCGFDQERSKVQRFCMSG